MTTIQKEQSPQVQPIDRLLDLLRTGQWIYGKAADIPEISTMLTTCADACFDINQMRPSLKAERQEAFRKLLGKVGENLVIHSPFRCDFGFNIRIGNNFVGNFNLTILDEAEVTIGDNVMIGPNCSLITITHALDPDQRNEGIMAARPITPSRRASPRKATVPLWRSTPPSPSVPMTRSYTMSLCQATT